MALLKNARRLTIGGGVLVCLVAVYGLMSGLFPGLGGSGSGNGTNVLVTGAGDSTDVPDARPSKPADDQREPNTEAAAPSDPAEVVNVLIDGRTYFLRSLVGGKEEHRRIELPALVDLAKAARGNEDGIRIRISRRESSRASAENLLQEKLTEAGLRKQSIYLQKGFVP